MLTLTTRELALLRSYHSSPPLTRGSCDTRLMNFGSSVSMSPKSESGGKEGGPVGEEAPVEGCVPERDQPEVVERVEVEREGSSCAEARGAGSVATLLFFIIPSAAIAMRTSSSSSASAAVGNAPPSRSGVRTERWLDVDTSDEDRVERDELRGMLSACIASSPVVACASLE